MRRKKHRDERLAACGDILMQNNISGVECESTARRVVVPYAGSLFLEIGCGKGGFIFESATRNPIDLYITMERDMDVIIMAMERVKAAELNNIRFIYENADKLLDFFSADSLDGIYLNFSDPWLKRRWHHRRLTHPSFLDLYNKVLKPGGFIAFKTDNTELFEYSVKSFSGYGFKTLEISTDLHNSEYNIHNIVTEYETNFIQQGIKINYIKVQKC